MITRVWLIRHGEPADVVGRCYGALDVGLSASGRSQMAQVAKCLGSEHLDAIYASPRLRTIESALIVASYQACGYQEDADLREIDFGDFEGLTYDEIAERYPMLYRQWMDMPTEVQFPNGESFSEMRRRVLRAFESILRGRGGQTIAIITHGGVIRVLIAWALEMPDTSLFRLAQNYGAMNLLTFTDGAPTVEAMNLPVSRQALDVVEKRSVLDQRPDERE